MKETTDEGMGLAAALVRSSFLVHAVYANASRDHGVTVQQGQLLCVLMARPRGMSELGAMLGLEKSSFTGLIDRAVKRGLVRRESDPTDGRAVQIALTREGRTVVDAFYTDTCRRIERLSDGIDADDRITLATLLSQVVVENQVPVIFLDLDANAGSN